MYAAAGDFRVKHKTELPRPFLKRGMPPFSTITNIAWFQMEMAEDHKELLFVKNKNKRTNKQTKWGGGKSLHVHADSSGQTMDIDIPKYKDLCVNKASIHDFCDLLWKNQEECSQ